ncbi:hypothetical protein KAU33_00535, partial [Candidatus Dependentiae bacterium]|nr:hypothetical protein [Candidatus Dependentiae bacterium]
MGKVEEMLSALKSEKIETWFDLGLYIDKLRENRDTPSTNTFHIDEFDKFKEQISRGIAFITF